MSPSAGLLVQGRRLRAKASEPDGDKTFLKISFPPSRPATAGSAAPGLTPRGAGGERSFRIGGQKFLSKGEKPQNRIAQRAPPRGGVRAGRPRGAAAFETRPARARSIERVSAQGPGGPKTGPKRAQNFGTGVPRKETRTGAPGRGSRPVAKRGEGDRTRRTGSVSADTRPVEPRAGHLGHRRREARWRWRGRTRSRAAGAEKRRGREGAAKTARAATNKGGADAPRARPERPQVDRQTGQRQGAEEKGRQERPQSARAGRRGEREGAVRVLGTISPSARAAGAAARGGRGQEMFKPLGGPTQERKGPEKKGGKEGRAPGPGGGRRDGSEERAERRRQGQGANGPRPPGSGGPESGPEVPRRTQEGGAGIAPKRRPEHPPPRPARATRDHLGESPRERTGPGRRSAQPEPPRPRGPKRGTL